MDEPFPARDSLRVLVGRKLADGNLPRGALGAVARGSPGDDAETETDRRVQGFHRRTGTSAACLVFAESDGLRTLGCRAAQGKESGRAQRRASPYASRQRVSSGTGPCARRDDTTSAEKDSTPVAPQRSRIRAHIQEAAACAVGHEQRVFVGEEDRPDHGDEPPSTCLTSTLPTCSWRPRGSR